MLFPSGDLDSQLSSFRCFGHFLARFDAFLGLHNRQKATCDFTDVIRAWDNLIRRVAR